MFDAFLSSPIGQFITSPMTIAYIVLIHVVFFALQGAAAPADYRSSSPVGAH